MRALIVEPGHTRAALAAARALHAAGWTVGIGMPGQRGLAASSRHVARRHRVPGPERGLDAFVEAVAAAIADAGYEVVFGGGDAEVLALSARRAELAAIVPYGPHEQVSRALDKLELAAASRSVGFSVPRMCSATGEELERSPLPFVVKASLHAPLSRDGGPQRLETRLAARRDEAARRVREIGAAGARAILQEFLSGRLLAYTVLADRESRVVARVQQVADLTWPPDLGISVRARTVSIDEQLGERAAGLMRELGWFGLAQLQFVAPPGGEPRLIDLNGRFYGSLALAAGAGVNLPAAWAALATGRPVPPIGAARPGVRYQWMEGDLRRAFAERRGGLLRDLLGCLRYARGAVHSVWSPEDPRPALHYLARVPPRAVREAAHASRATWARTRSRVGSRSRTGTPSSSALRQ